LIVPGAGKEKLDYSPKREYRYFTMKVGGLSNSTETNKSD